MEAWARHPVWTDYDVSDHGRVRRVTPKQGTRPGKVLKASPGRNGYSVVNIGGKPRTISVLVLEAFTGPRPPDHEARHLDDDRTNNRLSNLAWGTHAENYADRVANGGGNHGERHGLAKLTEASVREMKKRRAEGGVTYDALGEMFGVSGAAALMICKGERWSHVQ